MHGIESIVALIRHANCSTSYKPALLKSLVRIVRAERPALVPLERIGAEYLDLYWTQTVVFRLRQAATLTREPEVLKAIRAASEATGVRRSRDLPASVRRELGARLGRILRINVLQAFHASLPPGASPLYAWRDGEPFVTISAEARAFMIVNAAALESLANLWWARYLERVNRLAPFLIEKVERNGARRTSLVKYLAILQQTDDAVCFYCVQPLRDAGATHVDHVIPWSFLLDDPPWDLVLSCAGCNAAKSDRLPHETYLDKLAALNARRARSRLVSPGISPGFNAGRGEIQRYYDAARGIEWPAGWEPPLAAGF